MRISVSTAMLKNVLHMCKLLSFMAETHVEVAEFKHQLPIQIMTRQQ